MSKQGQLRNYTLLIQPGAQTSVKANGDYFRIIDADGGSVSVSTSVGDELRVREGEGARVRPFSELRFTNNDGVARRVVAVVGSGDFVSARTTGAVSLIPSGSLVKLGAYVGGGTIPANAGRQRLIMRADPNNAGTLAIAGLPLQPGDIFELDITGAVDLTGAATDTLHAAEVI